MSKRIGTLEGRGTSERVQITKSSNHNHQLTGFLKLTYRIATRSPSPDRMSAYIPQQS